MYPLYSQVFLLKAFIGIFSPGQRSLAPLPALAKAPLAAAPAIADPRCN